MKKLWNKLAKENALYYINSDKGKGITEKEFWESGRDSFFKLIVNDDMIKARFKPYENTAVDLGCGIGRITLFMATYFDKVTGLDISKEMIKRAKKKTRGIVDRIDYIETDGETIPMDDNSTDFVFSYLVFQHIKDRKMVEKNFKEVYRVLKPKGLFKVLIRSDKVDINKWWGGVEYTEQSIGKLIKKVGFNLLKTEPVKDYAFWLWLEK